MQPSLYAVPPAVTAGSRCCSGSILARSHRSRPAIWFFVVTALVAAWLTGIAVLYAIVPTSARRRPGPASPPCPWPSFPPPSTISPAWRRGCHRRRRALLTLVVDRRRALRRQPGRDGLDRRACARFWWGFYPAVRLGRHALPRLFRRPSSLLALAELWRDHRQARAADDRQRSRLFLIAFAVGTTRRRRLPSRLRHRPLSLRRTCPCWPCSPSPPPPSAATACPTPSPWRKEKFRALAGSASDAIASVNSRGDITYVNGAAARVVRRRPRARSSGGRWRRCPGSRVPAALGGVPAQRPRHRHRSPPRAHHGSGRPAPGRDSPSRWRSPSAPGTAPTAPSSPPSCATSASAGRRWPPCARARRSSAPSSRARRPPSSSSTTRASATPTRPPPRSPAPPAPPSLDRPFLDRFHADSHDIVRHRVLRRRPRPWPASATRRGWPGTDDRWVELTGRTLDFGGQPACPGHRLRRHGAAPGRRRHARVRAPHARHPGERAARGRAPRPRAASSPTATPTSWSWSATRRRT